MVECEYGWQCTVCRKSSSRWNEIAPKRCGGTAACKWAMRALQDAHSDRPQGYGHTLWMSDNTVWCSTCGQFSTRVTHGLARDCHPRRKGTTTQWTRLMRGKHPVTNMPFSSAAVPRHKWQLHPSQRANRPVDLVAAVKKIRRTAAGKRKDRRNRTQLARTLAPCRTHDAKVKCRDALASALDAVTMREEYFSGRGCRSLLLLDDLPQQSSTDQPPEDAEEGSQASPSSTPQDEPDDPHAKKRRVDSQ